MLINDRLLQDWSRLSISNNDDDDQKFSCMVDELYDL